MNVIKVPEILLPQGVDMRSYAVNACDQFTSDAAYWHKVEELCADKISAYNLIFPEIYLNDGAQDRIKKINAAMNKYLADGVFKPYRGFVLVERQVKGGVRKGVVLAVDLEEYSFSAGTRLPIRSTEATIAERIPPRVAIRKDAPIELPHVMLLYNDKQNAVLNSARTGETLYDFELNMHGGRVRGTLINNPEEVINAFYSLCGENNFLFAVGDGNHSLATAKTCWEEIKPTLGVEERKTHPARFALCEAVNIFDTALTFHPIHRLVKTDRAEELISRLNLGGSGSAEIVVNGARRKIAFPEDIPQGIRALDGAISEFLQTYGGEADYIHGEDELIALSRLGAGILLPPIAKDDFFALIEKGGNLPRKTFSLGEGNEKRYYIEAKKIR